MRYTAAHKEETHRRILSEASRAFRAEGISNVGVADVMQRLGLTHGGFYGHFTGKEHLVEEVCSPDAALPEMERLFAMESADDLATFIRRYLAPHHRDEPGSGCYLPSLASEVARSSPATRHAYTATFLRVANQVAAYMPGESAEVRLDAALVLLTGMAGAVAVARAVADPELSDRLLRQSRAFYLRAFGLGTETEEADSVEE